LNFSPDISVNNKSVEIFSSSFTFKCKKTGELVYFVLSVAGVTLLDFIRAS
jgi:hypothetical protein